MTMMLAYTILSSTAKKKKNPWHARPLLQRKRTLLAHKRIWFVSVFSYTHTQKGHCKSKEAKQHSALTGALLA
jgi:hypothetical protein